MISNRNKLTIGMKLARDKFAAGNFEGAIADYTEAIDRRLADKSELGPVDKNRLAGAYNGRGFIKTTLTAMKRRLQILMSRYVLTLRMKSHERIAVRQKKNLATMIR